MKSALRRVREAAQTTRTDEGQPSKPSRRKVATTDKTGEVSNGRTARKVSRMNKSGKAMETSATDRITLSHQPPAKPARQPRAPAISVEIKAAAGAKSKDTRVP